MQELSTAPNEELSNDMTTSVISSKFSLYTVDCETTGLDSQECDIIEISMYRHHDNVQKTWCLKPFNFAAIQAGALRVNGHLREDITHETKTGRETYLDPNQVIVEIENWMMEDGVTSEDRILVGQNPSFDKVFMEMLWKKCDSSGTFPFGRKMIDTIQMVLLMDLVKDNKRKGYGLGALVEEFGIKKEKAHTACGDVKMTKDLFLKLIEIAKEAFNK